MRPMPSFFKLTPSRLVYSLGLVALIYLAFRIFSPSAPSQGFYSRICDHSSEYLTDLHDLVKTTHLTLDKLDLTHILCYGSLVGQVRVKKSLPWEDNAEMCIFNEELIKQDEGYIGNVFRQNGLDVLYDSAEGRYLVTRKLPKPGQEMQVVKLIVFADDKKLQEISEPTYHRVGWKRRLLPAHCEFSPSLDCFPKRLVGKPIPTRLFGNAGLVPVPREHFELLKYHFPQNWWKEEKPINC